MEPQASNGGGAKMIGFGVLALLVVAGLGWFILGPKEGASPTVAVVESVATVNGVNIPKATFDTNLAQAITTLKGQGVDTASSTVLVTIKAQVLDDLVSNELVNQEVAKLGVTASAEEIQGQYDTILTQVGGADKLKEQLATASMTDAQLRENISKQLAVQKYLAQNINATAVTASDKEISDFYAEYKKTNKDAPTLKELSEQIKLQIIGNKQQALINTFVQQLRSKAIITTSPNL